MPAPNPLTKFPLNITPPGAASLHSPAAPINLSQFFSSLIGPVALNKKTTRQITPKSWIASPFLNKSPTATPLASMQTTQAKLLGQTKIR